MVFVLVRTGRKKKNLKRVYDFTEALWETPNFVRIDSITNYSKAQGVADEINLDSFISDPADGEWSQAYLIEKQKEIAKIPAISNYLISHDYKSIAVYGTLKLVKGSEGQVAKSTIENVQKNLLPKFESDELEILITGGASLGHAFQKETELDMERLLPVAFIALFIIFLLLFKSLKAAILSILLILITVFGMLGFQGLLDIKMGLVTAMCPLIIIAICVVDIVHIMASYNKVNEAGLADPLHYTLNKNLFPTFLTSTTTVLGFLSFLTSDLLPIVSMGILASFGIMLAWFNAIFLLAPILKLSPIKARYKKQVETETNNIFTKLAALISKRPITIVLFFTAAIGLSFYFSLKNEIDSNMQNYFSKDTEFRYAKDYFEDNIGGTNSIEILMDNSGKSVIESAFLTKADAFINELPQKVAGVTKVNSLLDHLKDLHQVINSGQEKYYRVAKTNAELAQELFFLEISMPPTKNINKMLSTDKKKMRVSIFWTRSSSIEIQKGRDEIYALLKKHGLNARVTGLTPLISGLDGYIVSSFIESMLLATVSIFFYMMFVFRSFFYGLVAIIPNIIVPSFGAAILYLTDRAFDAGSVLIFSICLGIAIDDTIYFITNFQRELKRENKVDTAIKNVLESAGKTLSYTTFILVLIFGIFYLGSFVPNQNFAIATCAILSTALLIDLTFLPSLITILSRNKYLREKFI